MPYKIITLGLIEQQPELYERLRRYWTLPPQLKSSGRPT